MLVFNISIQNTVIVTVIVKMLRILLKYYLSDNIKS